jgi:hypothetical protein
MRMLPPGFREIPASAWFDFSRVALFPATRLTRKQHSFPFFAFPNLFPGYYPIPEFLPTLMPPLLVGLLSREDTRFLLPVSPGQVMLLRGNIIPIKSFFH